MVFLFIMFAGDQAQRVSGSFSGTINGVRLDANVHVYVQTVEGKAYTAIDQLPAEIGPSLKSLYALGGVWGWLFAATTTPSAMNGYMLTGNIQNTLSREILNSRLWMVIFLVTNECLCNSTAL